MDNDVQLSAELQDLSDMEAACLVRETMRRANRMTRTIDDLAEKMVEMVMELAKKKLEKALDNSETECIIE